MKRRQVVLWPDWAHFQSVFALNSAIGAPPRPNWGGGHLGEQWAPNGHHSKRQFAVWARSRAVAKWGFAWVVRTSQPMSRLIINNRAPVRLCGHCGPLMAPRPIARVCNCDTLLTHWAKSVARKARKAKGMQTTNLNRVCPLVKDIFCFQSTPLPVAL